MTEILLGGILPLLLFATGTLFFIYLKGYPLRAPRQFVGALFAKSDASGVSPRQALLTALAGTLGVGNISGVAAAVSLGGAGALFWMWVCALFAMIIKYAEIVLALASARNGHGGAMYYIKKRCPAVLFALFCIACGFAMGNMTQVRAAAGAVASVFPKLDWIVGPLFALLLLAVLLQGKKGVFRFAERTVPIMTLLYCILSLLLLFRMRTGVVQAFRTIFQSAFSLRALGGGLGGSGLILALRYGAARGMISNEAGCGTAPIAHAASCNHPAAQGCLGIAEVFIDTILLCTLTGLCVLAVPTGMSGNGTALVLAVFQTTLGNWSGMLLAPAMALFAFATIVCWFYYTAECVRFLTGSSRFEKPLAILFSLACLIAPLLPEAKLFLTADLLICFMALINLFSLINARQTIQKLTLSYFQDINARKRKRTTQR